MGFLLEKVAPGDIRRSRDIGRVVQELESLDDGKAWRVTLEEVKSERSLKQNRYLFGMVYKILSEQMGLEKHSMHEEFLKMHFGMKLIDVPKSRHNPRGKREVPLRTTTTDEHGQRSVLGKTAFSELVDFIKRWAAEGDVFIPDPDPSLGIYEREQERVAA